MKKTFRLSALLCAMTLLVTSCSKNILDEPVIDPALNGTEIQFGSRAGFENANPNTRTAYSGEEYYVGGAKFERIDWVTNDQVTIYSPEAGGLNPAHYKVTQASVDENGAGNDEYDEGYLTKLMDGGLQWNTAKTEHTFYAMYPSPLQLPTGIQNLVRLDYSNGVKINAYISNEQHSQGVVAYDANDEEVDLSAADAAAKVKRYEVKPDMRFAYMAAKNTVNTGTADVTLDFVPVVTALRIELFLPESYKDGDKVVTSPDTSIGYVQLNCNGIAGAYTADLTKDDNEDGYPDCENADDAVNSIGMLINGNDNLPITLKANQSLCFTVFVRPGADINLKDIKVSFGLDPMSIRTKRLGTDATTNVIASLKKTSITGLKLPQKTSTITLTYDKWMSQIKDETKISELSILGTGGSFSADYKNSDAANFRQQTLPVFAERDADGNITKMGQWEMGVRAFEMACDRPQGSTEGSPKSLDGQPIRINKTSMGNWTIGSALRELLDKVTSNEYSTETAMAIITYQSEGATYDYIRANNRHTLIFAKALKNLYNTLITEQNGKYKDKIILYSPETVLYDEAKPEKSARGKLMIVCRVNQRDEGEPTDGNANELSAAKYFGDGTATNPGSLYNWERAKKEFENIPILLVNGCGTAKDRWKARGYQVSTDGINFATPWDILSDGSLSPLNKSTSMEAHLRDVYYTDGIQDGETWLGGNPYYKDNGNQLVTPNMAYIKKNASQHNYGTNMSYGIWYQDWARVVDLDYIRTKNGVVRDNFYVQKGQYPTHGWHDTEKLKSNSYPCWPESYTEKLADVKATFVKSISLNADDRKYVYINSLSGYLVDPAIQMSWTQFGYGSNNLSWDGGTQGNIQALAEKLNPAFGGYVREKISAQGERGATGVVLMDYLSSDPAAGASYFMPSVIISNNIYTGAADTTVPDVDPDDDGGNDNQNPGGGGTGGDDTGDEG